MTKCPSFCTKLNHAPLCSPGQQVVNSRKDRSWRVQWDLGEGEISRLVLRKSNLRQGRDEGLGK